MKKILLSIIALAACLVLAAQEECSTAWPYLYPEFREGTVYLKNGSKLQYQVNVHTLHGSLHYLDGGVVKEAVPSELLMVRIGDDEYMETEGSVMKVLARNEKGFVAALILGDFDKLSDSAGAYGSSTTSSATRKLSSLDLAGSWHWCLAGTAFLRQRVQCHCLDWGVVVGGHCEEKCHHDGGLCLGSVQKQRVCARKSDF